MMEMERVLIGNPFLGELLANQPVDYVIPEKSVLYSRSKPGSTHPSSRPGITKAS